MQLIDTCISKYGNEYLVFRDSTMPGTVAVMRRTLEGWHTKLVTLVRNDWARGYSVWHGDFEPMWHPAPKKAFHMRLLDPKGSWEVRVPAEEDGNYAFFKAITVIGYENAVALAIDTYEEQVLARDVAASLMASAEGDL